MAKVSRTASVGLIDAGAPTLGIAGTHSRVESPQFIGGVRINGTAEARPNEHVRLFLISRSQPVDGNIESVRQRVDALLSSGRTVSFDAIVVRARVDSIDGGAPVVNDEGMLIGLVEDRQHVRPGLCDPDRVGAGGLRRRAP